MRTLRMLTVLTMLGMVALLAAACATTPPAASAPIVALQRQAAAAVAPVVAAAAEPAAPDSLDQALEALAGHAVLRWGIADAAKTLAYVDARVKAGTMDELDAALARACPTVVTAAAKDFQAKVGLLKARLGDLRAGVKELQAGDGPELIYTLTRLKWGTQANPQDEVAALQKDIGRRVFAVIEGCRPLLPTQKLLDLGALAGKIGLTGGLAGF